MRLRSREADQPGRETDTVLGGARKALVEYKQIRAFGYCAGCLEVIDARKVSRDPSERRGYRRHDLCNPIPIDVWAAAGDLSHGWIWPGWLWRATTKPGIRRPLGHIVNDRRKRRPAVRPRARSQRIAASAAEKLPLVVAVNRPRWISPGGPEQGYNVASFESASKPPALNGMSGSERAPAIAGGPADRSPGERKIRHPDPARCPAPLLFRTVLMLP